MKGTFLPVCVLLFAAGIVPARGGPGPGQERPCRVPVSKSPAVRGLRLGMSTAELLGLFGRGDDAQLRARLEGDKGPPRYGVGSATFTVSEHPGAKGLAGVRSVSVNLFDGRVFSFYIYYDGPPQTLIEPWEHVDQLIEKVAKAYNLPGASAWSPADTHQRKELSCDGFTVTADVGSNCCPTLALQSTYPKEQIEARTRAAREKVREGFVP